MHDVRKGSTCVIKYEAGVFAMMQDKVVLWMQNNMWTYWTCALLAANCGWWECLAIREHSFMIQTVCKIHTNTMFNTLCHVFLPVHYFKQKSAKKCHITITHRTALVWPSDGVATPWTVTLLPIASDVTIHAHATAALIGRVWEFLTILIFHTSIHTACK